MAGSSFAGGKQLAVIEASSNCVPYPPPETTYEDLLVNPQLFMASLEKLHSLMGTKFMIPIIGGKELDLHRLFVEVTSRGGIEKVIRERKWKEVTSVFNFPSTATNASFVLRKYYLSLLHHFEQIYFFKAVGWTPASSDSPGAATIPRQGVAAMLPPSNNQSASQQTQTTAAELPAGSSSSASPAGGYPVVGVIDGKFDSGYLVTVNIGSEMLKGVLYQSPPEQPAQQQVLQPGGVVSKDGATSSPPNALRRRRRKKSEIKRRDPSHPKPNRSGYNFFFAEQHARLKPLYPGKDREISRMIGELWNKLQDSERTVYQEKAMKDKERYRMEMEDYREKQRTGQIISDAVPLQQLLPQPDLNMMASDKNEETTEGGDSPLSPDHDMSYVDGDSGGYKTEEKEEEEEEEEGEEDYEDDASPQAVGNLDVNILVEEEHCETRTAEEDVRKETRTAEEDVRKETSTVEEDVRKETRTAEEDVGKETSTVKEDVRKETRTAEEDVRKETSTVEEDVRKETRKAEEDVRKETSTVEEGVREEMRTAEEDVGKQTSTIGDDKEVFAGDTLMVEAKEVFAGDTVMVEEAKAGDTVMVDEAKAGDTVMVEEAKAGDTVMVEAKEEAEPEREPTPTTAIRED